MIVALLLVAIGILLCTRRSERDHTPGLMVLIGGFIWLAIEIHLLSMLGDLFAAALRHWIQIAAAFSVTILLIVPAIMIFIAIRDKFDSRRVLDAHNPVRNAFERRVETHESPGLWANRSRGDRPAPAEKRLSQSRDLKTRLEKLRVAAIVTGFAAGELLVRG